MAEFLLGCILLTFALGGASALIRAHWIRLRCSIQTFEAAHARLTSSSERERFPLLGSSPSLLSARTGDGIQVTGICEGGRTETVRLKTLESARW